MRHYGCVPHNWEYSLAGPGQVTGASCELLTLMFNCVHGDRDTDQPDHPDPATGQLDTCQAGAETESPSTKTEGPPNTNTNNNVCTLLKTLFRYILKV